MINNNCGGLKDGSTESLLSTAHPEASILLK